MADHPPGTDIAALSAGVVAVSVSLFVSPGQYSIINLIISFTLLAIVAGYVWPFPRRRVQTFAFAAAIGLATIPGIGFFDEAARSQYPMQYLVANFKVDCDKNPEFCSKLGEPRTNVPDKDIIIGWIAVVVVMVAADRIWQRKLTKKST